MSTIPPLHQAPDSAIFLGRDADAFSALIAKQIEPIFDRIGLVVPVKSCSLLSKLADIEPASAADLAKALGQSHQLVLQKIPALLAAKLVRRKSDASDQRRRVFSLTARGKRQLELLRDLSPTIKAVYAELYEELGIDVQAMLEKASTSLRERPLMERFPAAAFSTRRAKL